MSRDWKRPDRFDALALPRLILLSLLCLPAMATALPWFQDMRNQPSVQPQRTVVETPENSVPRDGKRDVVSPPRDQSELVRARIEAGGLASPIEADAASIERGRVVYRNHCQSCHGAGGQGDGPVGAVFRPAPINLTFDYVREQPEGRLFYTITHGSLIMPEFRHAIRPEDRWHLVNFLKQGLGEQ